MITCPYCDYHNIEGMDVCEQCGQPLDDLHLPDPTTAVERGLLADTIASLSPRSPVTVAGATPVGEVLNLLVEREIGCVFIVDDDQIKGVFSERDALIRLNANFAALKHEPVAKFMTPSPQSLEAETRICFAVQRMDLGGFRHVPIVDESERVQGVISVRDILRYLTEKMTETSTG